MAYFDDPYSDESDPYVAWARAQQQFALPGELAKGTAGSLPPPPPPPQTLAQPGVPVVDEVPQGVVAPEPPPMQVDAVSQAAPAAQVADIVDVHQEQPAAPPSDVYAGGQVEGQTPDAYLQHMQQVADTDSLPSSRERTTEDATQRAVMAMTPQQLAQYNAHRESAMVLEQARLQHEAELENQRRIAANFEIQQAATSKADADMQDVIARAHDLANSTTNPDRYKAQRGTGETIRDMAMMFFSGLGGNADGAMRVLDNRIARDIDSQKMAIENGWKSVDVSRNEIANEYARHGDLYRAAETVRLAKYQSMYNDIQTQMQMYDPAGSSALRGRAAMDQLQAQIDQGKAALWQQSFKNTIDYLKAQSEYDEKMANVEKTQAETAKILGKVGGKTKVVKFEDTPMTLAQLRGFGVAIPDGVAEPPNGLSINQAKKLAESGKTAEEWAKASRENSSNERNRQFGVGEIVDKNGQPVQFRDSTVANKVAEAKAGLDTISGLLDEMVRIRNKSGWTSDLAKSQDWTLAQGALASALLESKNVDQLGALSGSDITLEMKKLVGGLDTTGARDPVPALLAARRRMVDKFNATLRAQPVAGAPPAHWEPPNMATLKDATPLVQGKTGIEQGEGAKHPLAAISFYSNDERSRRGEEGADVGPTGLDKSDDKRVLATIEEAKSGNTDAVQRLADAASTNRASVNDAVLSRVRTEAPDIYSQVVEKLSPAQRKDIETATPDPAEVSKISFETMGVEQLVPNVRNDDALRQFVIDKALHGSPIEKRKAADVLSAAMKAGGK